MCKHNVRSFLFACSALTMLSWLSTAAFAQVEPPQQTTIIKSKSNITNNRVAGTSAGNVVGKFGKDPDASGQGRWMIISGERHISSSMMNDPAARSFTTDSNGFASLDQLDPGSYWLIS